MTWYFIPPLHIILRCNRPILTMNAFSPASSDPLTSFQFHSLLTHPFHLPLISACCSYYSAPISSVPPPLFHSLDTTTPSHPPCHQLRLLQHLVICHLCPNMHLNTFFSQIPNLFSFLLVNTHVSLRFFKTTGLKTVFQDFASPNWISAA